MTYLILQRNEGEEVVLSVAPEVSDEELIRQLRGDGIRVVVANIQRGCVRLGFSAPHSIKILRDELVEY